MGKNIIESLNNRYATKIFDTNKRITQDHLNIIVEAVRLTPTSFGLQLMKLVIVENKDLRKELLLHSFGQNQVVDASHLIILCREKIANKSHISDYISNVATTRNLSIDSLNNFKNMMENYVFSMSDSDRNEWMNKQVYIALGNLLTTCAILKIDSCPMEGFKPNEYSKTLSLEEKNLEAVLVIPVGYRSENDKNAIAKKVRRLESEFKIIIE